MEQSVLQTERYKYQPKLPRSLTKPVESVVCSLGEPTEAAGDPADVRNMFPITYGQPIAEFSEGANSSGNAERTLGVILSGGQAPGGHNVICGLYDAVKAANSKSRVLGFLGGPSGLLEKKYQELDDATIDAYRNTGGFDIIGSGRTKIETDEQFEQSAKVARELDLDGIVIIGGDDSNTNAALLAEYFRSHNVNTQVIGVPKTIDGDLRNEYIEASFGFDTAVKVYSELIGNIGRDANSAKKYWHFIRVMGRSASHIALECALQTQPNICIVSEEVAEKKRSLADIVEEIAGSVRDRAANGENFGVAIIPEGLIEFVPEMNGLIGELNDTLSQADATGDDRIEEVSGRLSAASKKVFDQLPHSIKEQLLMDRDPHGNVQVSRIDTEKLLAEMVGARLAEMKTAGEFKGKFSALTHFFGYEGRCAFPSNFDADYCYGLGYTAFVLVANGLTGYIASIRNLADGPDAWKAGGIPLTMLMNMERRHGSNKPVIRKALVELDGKPFRKFAEHREQWRVQTRYASPGAIQYFGPASVCDRPTETLLLERS
ncbi:MAG: diphosphate--fructose-6-phosphate 1-phosphotransferase [Spirochaetales bacterium]